MATQVWDQAAFQAQFPEFAGTPGSALQGYWNMAVQYMNPNDGCLLSGSILLLGLNLLTAHLARLFAQIAAGAGNNTPGVVTGAGEGSVNVSMAPPPFRDGWQYWLSTTPYGQQLWALLQANTAGGLYVGGSLERASFRKAGGVF